MNDRFLLVDLESVQPVPGDVEAWMALSGSAWVFHGPHQLKALRRYAALGERVTLVPISRPGKKSLDFHLVFYLGYPTARNPNAKFAVLSKDNDYDPAIAHARMLFGAKVDPRRKRVTQLAPLKRCCDAGPACQDKGNKSQ